MELKDQMRVFALMLLMCTLLGARSQTKTYVGIKGGAHVKSSFLEHTIFNFNARIGFNTGAHAGVFIKHFPRKRPIAFNAGIQGSFNYVQKGWVQSFPDTNIPNYQITMNYLEVPIEGIGYFGKNNKYFITAGFYTEFLLSAQKDPPPTGIENIDFATYEADRDREVGYGGRLSGGLFRDFSFGSLHFEGFFTYSFSSFIDAGDLTNDQLPDISNLWNVGVSIGYLIPFGKLDLTK